MADGERRISDLVPGVGEWEGWTEIQTGGRFLDIAGPFYFRDEPDGTRRSAFRVEERHLNGQGGVHGGALATLADYSLFMIAIKHVGGSSPVTVSLNTDYLGAARLGDRLEASGEVVKAGAQLVFVRGKVTAGEKPILGFTGVIMKRAPR
jgi:uncharacterized protein (TIGR00369 family)